MHSPYFTVMMPLYNHEKYVGDAIDSVLGQTFGDFELIVCNDGSTDGSLELVHAVRDPRLQVIDKPNGGVASALNACLMRSSGRYICWLSSDDLYAADKLRAHFIHHDAHPESTLSIGPYGFVEGDQFSTGEQIVAPDLLRLLPFLDVCHINGLTPCVNRALYMLYGQFDNRHWIAQDGERWYQLFRHQVPTFLAGAPLSFTRKATGHLQHLPYIGLMGDLDMLKFLFREFTRSGLRAFLPAPHTARPISLEFFMAACERLLSQKNYFYRFDLRNHVLHTLARWIRDEGVQNLVAPTLAHLQARSTDAGARWAHDELQQVAAIVERDAPFASVSFAEHVVRLKDAVAAPELRQVLERFLDFGF